MWENIPVFGVINLKNKKTVKTSLSWKTNAAKLKDTGKNIFIYDIFLKTGIVLLQLLHINYVGYFFFFQ